MIYEEIYTSSFRRSVLPNALFVKEIEKRIKFALIQHGYRWYLCVLFNMESNKIIFIFIKLSIL